MRLTSPIQGINIFLAGFVPTENLRFRDEEISFKVAEVDRGNDSEKKFNRYKYPTLTKTLGDFKARAPDNPRRRSANTSLRRVQLTVERGDFTDSEIIVMLGENGTGKTTFIRLLAGLMPPDDDPDLGEPVRCAWRALP